MPSQTPCAAMTACHGSADFRSHEEGSQYAKIEKIVRLVRCRAFRSANLVNLCRPASEDTRGA